MEKILIIDNVSENFQLQPHNGVHIKNFEGDENDTELIDITLDLITITKMKIDDVKKYIPKIRQGMIFRNELVLNRNRIPEVSESAEKMETVESIVTNSNEQNYCLTTPN
jgi:hypothetical protein